MTTSEIHAYDAAKAPRGILKHVLPVLGYPGVIASHTTILANFFRRDLLGRFRGSFLGIFWVLVQPLFMFAVYFFVFGFLFAPRIMQGSGPNIEFALYLFSGIIAFSSFIESTTRSCSVVMDNGNLVKKVAFPAELLPLPNVLVNMIVYVVGAIIFLAFGLWSGHVEFGLHTLALPLVLIVQATMCVGIGLLLATLQVLMRDTAHLYQILSQAWFFLTPVFWPHRMLEEKLGETSWILELNPMYPLIQAHRQALGFVSREQGLMHHFVPPDNPDQVAQPLASLGYHLGSAAAWSVAFLILGYSFFMSRKKKFADLV